MNAADLDLERTAQLFQALSDETRLGILLMLTRGERCVCELQPSVGAYQSRLSFHLRRLKDAGLVTDRKEGRWVYYAARPEALEEMRAFLAEVEPVNEPAASCGDGCCG